MDPTYVYATLAVVVGGAVYVLRRLPGTSEVWQRIPSEWRWLVPVIVAAGGAFVEAQSSGRGLSEAAGIALAAALSAIGGHTTLKESVLPYGRAK